MFRKEPAGSQSSCLEQKAAGGVFYIKKAAALTPIGKAPEPGGLGHCFNKRLNKTRKIPARVILKTKLKKHRLSSEFFEAGKSWAP